jgi:hypothetical protein
MEFSSVIKGVSYTFSKTGHNYFLVSGNGEQWIIYKTDNWRCLDSISPSLLSSFCKVLNEWNHKKSLTNRVNEA